jgi:hypothetical protein
MLTFENMPFIIYFRNIEKMNHHMCTRLLLTIRDVKLKNTADRPPPPNKQSPQLMLIQNHPIFCLTFPAILPFNW